MDARVGCIVEVLLRRQGASASTVSNYEHRSYKGSEHSSGRAVSFVSMGHLTTRRLGLRSMPCVGIRADHLAYMEEAGTGRRTFSVQYGAHPSRKERSSVRQSIRKRGSVRQTTGGTLFEWPRGRHSEKPTEFYSLVEKLSPRPRLEMFARKEREGWAVWGNEVNDKLTPSIAEVEASSRIPQEGKK